MPRDRKPASDYAVGYGRPPQHTRFKPGQSGNPKGRSKGARNFKSVLQEELNRPVVITENGRSRKAPIFGVILRQSLAKAVKGDLRALMPVFTMAHRMGLFGDAEDENPKAEAHLSADDEALLRELLGKIAPTGVEGEP